MTLHDYPTYAMLARMTRNNFVFDDAAKTYLHMHPAFRALSFIPTLVDNEISKLLVTTIDPRWYIDRRRPDRIKKLELFLGLTPAVQEKVSNPKKLLSKPRELRCALVLNSWKSKP